ncbi:MAG: hypothetical protein RL756_692 [Pseudomonadota bacterium]|jgi:hypothetical protein
MASEFDDTAQIEGFPKLSQTPEPVACHNVIEITQSAADNTEAMRQALDWLTDEQSVEDEDCGEAMCGDCIVVRKRQVIIDALKRALGERDE